jgi:hypothetical protein
MAAGPFMVAAAARLARVHAGQAFIHAVRKMPAQKHHAGMMAKKSSNPGNFLRLWGYLIGQPFQQLSVLT